MSRPATGLARGLAPWTLLGVLWLLPQACEATNPSTASAGEGASMTESAPDDSAFQDVVPGSFSSNAATPEIDDFDVDFRGLKLNAPSRVELTRGAAFAHFVVCGVGVFDWNYMDLDGDFLESIVIVAVDSETHQSRSGRMRITENRAAGIPVREKLGLSAEDFANRSVEKYFNPDVGALLELPAAPATYDVYATLGEYKSNVVEVQLVPAGASR
jgi:hypothetical protein